MGSCVMANAIMAEDFLLRAIYAKYREKTNYATTKEIREKAKEPCEKELVAATKRYGSGSLIQIEYQSCLRREYHKTGLALIK